MKTSAIIVAGGQANRYGQDKLWLPYQGSTVLQKTAEVFLRNPRIHEVIVVVPKARVQSAKTILPACKVVAGGKTRAQSVQKGLAMVAYRHVLIHDGARPNVSDALIDRVVAAFSNYTAVVPQVPLCDSLTRDEIYCNREEYGAVQTPQGFETALLLDCFAKATREYPDEGSLVADFAPVHFVRGEAGNRKLTYPVDMVGLQGETHYGIGYDIHRLTASRPLLLGGVLIDYPMGLLGHSDADCVLHAVMDAMLSAVGEKDIGHLFPTQDERWAGADSTRLLGIVKDILAQKSTYVTHVSVSIVAEQPRLAPYVNAICNRIGALLAVPPANVGVAVTTNEGIPLSLPFAAPTKDAIAAMAVVTVCKSIR